MTARTLPDMHVYEEYGWLRGMNVIPSWASRIEEPCKHQFGYCRQCKADNPISIGWLETHNLSGY